MSEKDEFCGQVRLCEAAMYAVAFSIVRNDADCAEIISESVFRAYRKNDALRNRNAFKAWILKIVHNTAVEFVRKRANTVSLDEIDSAGGDDEDRTATALTVRAAVGRLDQPYRTVIELYYFEDFSVYQISQITSVTSVTVKKRLSRAREQLREILREDFGNE